MASKITWGGLAGIATAVLLLLSAIINQLSPMQQTYDSAASYLYLVIVIAGYLTVIITVRGIHALHARSPRYGRFGTVGSVLTIVGYAIVAIVRVISMVQGQASLLTLRLVGAAAILVGSALLGVIILRARLLPWWCGVLLIVAFPLGHFANEIFSPSEQLLMALLWGSMGIALLVRRQAVTESMASQPA